MHGDVKEALHFVVFRVVVSRHVRGGFSFCRVLVSMETEITVLEKKNISQAGKPKKRRNILFEKYKL